MDRLPDLVELGQPRRNRLDSRNIQLPGRRLHRIVPHAVGRVTGEGETFPYALLSGDRGHDRSIVSFYLPGESALGPDLTWLAAKVAARVLTPEISWRGPWDKAPKAMDALLNRRLHGKAVLDIT